MWIIGEPNQALTEADLYSLELASRDDRGRFWRYLDARLRPGARPGWIDLSQQGDLHLRGNGEVNAGDLIGHTGNSGKSYGSHLPYEDALWGDPRCHGRPISSKWWVGTFEMTLARFRLSGIRPRTDRAIHSRPRARARSMHGLARVRAPSRRLWTRSGSRCAHGR